jgi:hypothetical protein
MFEAARCRPSGAWTGYAALIAAAGCGDSDTTSRLAIDDGADGTVLYSEWHYESFEVDVDLELVTEERPDACTTTASLSVNDVVSATDRYLLEPTDCTVLRLTAEGDIVFFEQETGHDWSREALQVDTESEVISLGPVATPSPAERDGAVYRFALSAPPCPDQPDCACGKLERFGGGEPLALPLGRQCD